jgi:hypothetical protein
MVITKDDLNAMQIPIDKNLGKQYGWSHLWLNSKLKKIYKHDFKTKEGILSYVKACEEASKIPELTDRNFYSNMIDANKYKFGSKKQLADRKLNAVNV